MLQTLGVSMLEMAECGRLDVHKETPTEDTVFLNMFWIALRCMNKIDTPSLASCRQQKKRIAWHFCRLERRCQNTDMQMLGLVTLTPRVMDSGLHLRRGNKTSGTLSVELRRTPYHQRPTGKQVHEQLVYVEPRWFGHNLFWHCFFALCGGSQDGGKKRKIHRQRVQTRAEIKSCSWARTSAFVGIDVFEDVHTVAKDAKSTKAVVKEVVIFSSQRAQNMLIALRCRCAFPFRPIVCTPR